MQNREQIQKEIDAVKLQLSIADMSALTASPEEKDRWNTQRDSLQVRLNELMKDLEESVVYDGDNAASILDDATADAMLNEILNAPEEPQDMQPDEADGLLNSILNAPDDDAPVTQSAERDEDELDNILFTSADGDAVAAENENVAEADGTDTETTVTTVEEKTEEVADALVDAEQADTDEASENDVSPEAAAAEEMLRKILGGAKASEPEKPAQDRVAAAREKIAASAVNVADRLDALRASDGDAVSEIERLRREAEEANRKAQEALAQAERMRKEAEEMRLNAETERAMYAAEMELQRGLHSREAAMRQSVERAEKDRLAEKIARRKAEIAELRNQLQNIQDSQGAFALREKFLAVELVLDDDERGNAELSYLLTKSIDDVAHALEVAELKHKIAALTAAKRAPAKRAATKKKAAKKPAKKKKKAVAAPARRGRPPLRASARRRPSPRSYR